MAIHYSYLGLETTALTKHLLSFYCHFATHAGTMGSTNRLSKLMQLSATISTSIAEIQQVLDAEGAPSPSFDEDAPPLPTRIAEARDAVLDATAELHDLLMEPLNMIHRAARVRTCTHVPPSYQVSRFLS